MASYPNSVYSHRTRENKSGVVYDANKTRTLFVEDVNKSDDEIAAIETELGTNLKGGYADVKARIVAIEGVASGKMTNPMNTGGDIIYGGASGAPTRLAKGTNLQVMRQASDIPAWQDDEKELIFIIDGGGSAITTGEKGHLEIPFKCEIQRVTTLADQSGSIKIDIWKDTYANFPPTDDDTICGGNEPEISSATKDQDATLTDWTKTINAGDILAFNVDSASTVTRVTIALKVKLIA